MCRSVEGKKSRVRCTGFTLVELLTVLGIMVVILAVAVPVFDSMTGSHSTAAAQNIIASTLATARADAIFNRQITGVFFFLDPATGRFAMAEVQADTQRNGGVTYTPGGGAIPPANANGDGTYPVTPPPNNGPLTALEMVNYYTSPPPKTAVPGSYTYYRDVVELPVGVGLALNNNYYGFNVNFFGTNQPFDRYVRTGVILFDSTGSLITIPYAVQQIRDTPYTNFYPPAGAGFYNQLALRIGLSTTNGGLNPPTNYRDFATSIAHPPALPVNVPSANGFYPLFSQVGFVLYNHDAFLNQKTTNNSTPGDAFTDVDLNYLLPYQSTISPAPNQADKNDEENWLDSNSTAILVSPVNGTLVAAQ
jgi:prepilin-type N-terminal cleavage/methylation domain-containing protein